ncbi:adenylate/guanylate cyclase domain-containing protein [Laspinema olomoucense]|uniref:adenylate/guanylate cyclase domain-containing protein n=1 Tax=Laspinema olomoucense TaxID=3231600 RepID=UPI0021BBAACC|nr:adenylate/guanylate cyclase domain-containing protein [Laspinema sp. D3d]MCT7975629.1 PAS domain S-box protein [Laspinema sp. D3d]
MNPFFKKFLVVHGIEYLILDSALTIRKTSEGVNRFSDSPGPIQVNDEVGLAFPELIGVEDLLQEVLEGRQMSFDLKSLSRFTEAGKPVYFDMYVVQDDQVQGQQLIVFLEDVTDRMSLEQRLVQATNETHLLLAALFESKRYIEQILSSMAEALIVTSETGLIKKVNQSTLDLFEYSEAELLGKGISQIVGIHQDLVKDFFLSQIDRDEPGLAPVEIVCHTKTRKKVYVGFSCAVIDVSAADIPDLVYIGRDITDRKRKQQRNLAQSATMRILSESANLVEAVPKLLPALCDSLEWDVGEIWQVQMRDGGGDYLSEVSRESEQQPDCLTCLQLWHRQTPEWDGLHQNRKTQLAEGEGLPGHVWASHEAVWTADLPREAIACPGTEYLVQAGLNTGFAFPIFGDASETEPLVEPSSELLGVIGFYSRDVQTIDEDLMATCSAIASQIGQFIKRKQAEIALQESEERYRDLFENASDLIQSVSIEGRFLYVNRAWKETLGYSEADLERLTVFELLHPQSKPQYQDRFDRIFAGETLDEVTAEFMTKSGQTIFLQGSMNCKYLEGNPVAIRGIFRNITERIRVEKALQKQQKKTENLLLNILPEPIVDRLKLEPNSIAETYANVTVLFADLVGFTEIASELSALEVVELLNLIFSAFDRLTELHQLEKIKTIGDAYMVVAGLPTEREDHAEAIADMALDMQTALSQFNQQSEQSFSIRIGIHSGPVVAGVIGIKKFIYDLWGDTVNIASRMESHSLPGRIQVSETTYYLLREHYELEKRGPIAVKGKGEMNTYFLIGSKSEF